MGRYCPQLLADYLLLAAAPPSGRSKALLHFSSHAAALAARRASGSSNCGAGDASAAAAAVAAEEDALAGAPLSRGVAAALRRGASALYGACSASEVWGRVHFCAAAVLWSPASCTASLAGHSPLLHARCFKGAHAGVLTRHHTHRHADSVPVRLAGHQQRRLCRQLAGRPGSPEIRLREAFQVYGQGVSGSKRPCRMPARRLGVILGQAHGTMASSLPHPVMHSPIIVALIMIDYDLQLPVSVCIRTRFEAQQHHSQEGGRARIPRRVGAENTRIY